MPKITVDKRDDARLYEDDIGTTREDDSPHAPGLKSITEQTARQLAPEK